MFRFAARALFAIAILGSRCFAHNPDTSYARVLIRPNAVELRLTFDVFTLKKIVPGIDANADLALSKQELHAATPAIQKFLRARVGMEISASATELGAAGTPFWPLDAPDPIPAKDWHANESLISFPFDQSPSSPPKSVALLFDLFETLGDRHTILGVFEYGGRSHEVIFNAAEPDYLFDIAHADAPGTSTGDSGSNAHRSNVNASPLVTFLWEGVKHIFFGIDHICFLLVLLVVSRLRELIGIITAFTVAHSITLFLAARGFVHIPVRLVESAIAVTIIYVAVENLIRLRKNQTPPHRWMLSFAFGLVHGFGFANVLGELQLPTDSFVRCLLMFNVGVELGQLAIVAILFGLVAMLSKPHQRVWMMRHVSQAVCAIAACWLVDRAFQLEFMPF